MLLFVLFAGIFALIPRNVKISGTDFINAHSNDKIVMVGPNVVVKGPPYLPYVKGTTFCDDVVNSDCAKTGTCKSCSTFNEADVAHIKSMGWNTIRLGVVWAGAQLKDADSLDPTFLNMLHDVLNLTDRTGINVILDNHGDMVGSAGCGNGVPMWIQKKAAPDLIGKPLETNFPYSLVSKLRVTNLGGYSHCGSNASMWAEHAGDPNYNLLNQCCQSMNSGNPAALGYTSMSQKTMDYVMKGEGRAAFVRFWRLMAEAVKDHPSAFAAELMNEPMSIRRGAMYDTWQECAEAINAIIPDMSVAIADTGEGAIFPAWISKLIGPGVAISSETVAWIKKSNNVFYAWHYYGNPKKPADAIKNAVELGEAWNVPTFLTEFGPCEAWRDAAAANISHTYWHHSSYCTTGPSFGNRTVPQGTFGACILGWAGADSSKNCN